MLAKVVALAAVPAEDQQNLGTVHCSNIYIEITQYTSADEVAVNNLDSIAVPAFVSDDIYYDFEPLQVSDAILDTSLRADPKSNVACETATKDNMVKIAGEITTQAKVDYDAVGRKFVEGIGFTSYVDDLSSVESMSLSNKACEVLVSIDKQNRDIAGVVHAGRDDMDVGAGEQGTMLGYASDETQDCMPLTHSMATRFGKKLTDVRKNGDLWWLRPDGKTQVTIE